AERDPDPRWPHSHAREDIRGRHRRALARKRSTPLGREPPLPQQWTPPGALGRLALRLDGRELDHLDTGREASGLARVEATCAELDDGGGCAADRRPQRV